MPQSAPAFPPPAAAGVVGERGQPRLPLGGELRLGAERGHGREGHRERAADPGLDLRQRDEHRGARDVRARHAARATAARAGPAPIAERQQRVPRRVELDLVDAARRSGRACAAPAGARSPAGPTRAARRRAARRAPTPAPPSRRRPRARAPRRAAGSRRRGRSPRAAAAGSRAEQLDDLVLLGEAPLALLREDELARRRARRTGSSRPRRRSRRVPAELNTAARLAALRS